MITIPILLIVAIVFILHTILTHLINWLARESTGNGFGLAMIFSAVEIIIIMIILETILN